tara:strand:+ start:113 stop:742 length:630 start_codon:yes stop_codon:yes gene_type:complete
MKPLGDWAQHIVLAGYSNGYAGYITTPEEYSLQQYEGGHTLHGQWTLPAYQQIANYLATMLETDAVVESTASYDDWRGKSTETSLKSDSSNRLPSGTQYGEPLPLHKREYKKGETIVADFWSSNPSTRYVTGNNYMAVEVRTQVGWDLIATDSDWNTTIRWRIENSAAIAQLSWEIPLEAASGDYRLRHNTRTSKSTDVSGMSRNFTIE